MSVGEYIRKKRKKIGLTQLELAQIVGSSLSAINRLERDVLKPSDSFMDKICDVLDFDLESPDIDKLLALRIIYRNTNAAIDELIARKNTLEQMIKVCEEEEIGRC